MAKNDVSWKRKDPDGTPRQVYAERWGGQWRFFVRERRYDQWMPLAEPPLDDWLELLDAVQRRIARHLLPPEEEERIRTRIMELFPGTVL